MGDAPSKSERDTPTPSESESESPTTPRSGVVPAAAVGTDADPVVQETSTPPTGLEPDEEEGAPVASLPVEEPQAPEESTPPRSTGRGGHRLTLSDWLRPDFSQSVIAIVLAAFSFAVVTQIHTRDQVDSYSSLRQSDLVGMIDGLNQESQRLQGELESLRQAQTELESGQDSAALARAQAEQRLTSLGILAGTLAAQGPGITLTISDPANNIKPGTLLDAVEEMRDAGAEAIQVNGTVRIVASSWFSTGPSGIIIDGQAVSTPIKMEVIGDPHSLEEAARFRGGLVSQITDPRVGGHVTITRSDNLVISSLHQPQAPRYARPQKGSAPAPSTPGN
ncbi:DUF881 domain-containing protein [Raineyella antarctica]|uniref:DUF881 domain-containing protein n=1 Tax=Raineyella antarctica TaxID=1577474 RepID=UPI001FDF8166|nr:DUF881 domain-containing protein [Raineyella antarctica]